MTKVRCAIYTRKSSDEGLDQAFNSLDAQREACEAYIKSQKHEGWKTLPILYDDGGASGGNLDRTALKQLLADIDANRVDMIVVYKIDRLTRSLSDFAKLVDRLDAAGATFVSVTQQFNTSTSMGRLTLNVLLSFAQFEREVTAERIRDKIAASKKKGMWMGGLVPLGYDKTKNGLRVCKSEALLIQNIFQCYLNLGCVRRLKQHLDSQKLKSKTRTLKSGTVIEGKPFARGQLYHLLSNPIYVGKVRHKGQIYDGLHEGIISQDLWDNVQVQLASNAIARKTRKNMPNASPLAGKVYDADGKPLTPTHANKSGKRYRYYVSASGIRLSATELETAINNVLSADRELALRLQTETHAKVHDNLMELVERIELQETTLKIYTILANDTDQYVVEAPFTLRRRGVENRMTLNQPTSRNPDLTLIRRVLKAMHWVDEVKLGNSISKIAEAENVSPEYITHNIGLGYLSPKILKAISEGRQRSDISAYQLSKVTIPAAWPNQDAIFLD